MSDQVAKPIEVAGWDAFTTEIRKIESRRYDQSENIADKFDEPLYRGMGSSSYSLTTTLERAYPLDSSEPMLSLLQYYRKIDAAKPAIETLTGKPWLDVPDWWTFKTFLEENNKHQWLDRLLGSRVGIYRYLIYLRHHGFPSPLLDWTRSPYIAALFAFDQMERKAESVCVYAYSRHAMTTSSSEEHFFIVGPYIDTDRRHYLQQSRYSLCVALNDGDYAFKPHEPAMIGRNSQNGELVKLIIPATFRGAFLRELELMNINPYSLFASEDSLVRTIARRECYFKNSDF